MSLYESACGARMEGLRTIVATQHDNNPLYIPLSSHCIRAHSFSTHAPYLHVQTSIHKLISTLPRTHPGTTYVHPPIISERHPLHQTTLPAEPHTYIHRHVSTLAEVSPPPIPPQRYLPHRYPAPKVRSLCTTYPASSVRGCGLLSRADRAGTCSAQWTGGAEGIMRWWGWGREEMRERDEGRTAGRLLD